MNPIDKLPLDAFCACSGSKDDIPGTCPRCGGIVPSYHPRTGRPSLARSPSPKRVR